MSAKRLATAMQKGGVGKSTTSINLAGALADDTDHTTTEASDVLLVDADPQGFSTITAGLMDYYTNEEAFSLYDCLTDVEEMVRVEELIFDVSEFDILAAHGQNFILERELWSLPRTHERLGMALDEISDGRYDYILIDTPPNLGPLADGALLAAENVMLASKADRIASFSVGLLLEEIGTLERQFDIDIETVGVTVNQYEQNKITDERIEWFTERVGDENVYTVPDTVAVEGALSQGGSIFNPEYTPDNNHREKKAVSLRDTYDQLAQQVVNHYE